MGTPNKDRSAAIALLFVLVVALLWLLALAFVPGCYTGNPPWPYDPTQPAGSIRYEVLPVYDGGAPDLPMPPLPEKPPREVTWCER
jgi:hypothetical protein